MNRNRVHSENVLGNVAPWLALIAAFVIAAHSVSELCRGLSQGGGSEPNAGVRHTDSAAAPLSEAEANSTIAPAERAPRPLRTKNIEDIRVGEFVLARNNRGSQSNAPNNSSGEASGSGTADCDADENSARNDSSVTPEVAFTYTYDEPFGVAEATYLFAADEILQLPDDCEAFADDLVPGEVIRLRDGMVGMVKEVRPAPVGERTPPGKDPAKYRRVIGTVKHTVHTVIDVTCGGETLTCTPNHPFWVVDRGAWVAAGELRRGDRVRRVNGSTAFIESVSRPREGEFTVYNLEVEGLHTYYVGSGGVLVHNGGRCITDPFHGNDLRSTRPTTLYRLVNGEGKVMKYGISSNLAKRYPGNYLPSRGWELREMAVGSRRYVYDLEAELIARHRPPFNFGKH